MLVNAKKITKEFCKGKKLIFFPGTEDEAAFIQKSFFAMGFSWIDDSRKVEDLKECVADGMSLEREKITLGPFDVKSQIDSLRCFSSQFDPAYDALTSITDKIIKLSSEERQELLVRIKEQCADDFAEAARNPVALRRDTKVKPPLRFPPQP